MLWAFSTLGHTPALAWQHACVHALRDACASACGQPEPFEAALVRTLLEEAGLLRVLGAAVAQQEEEDKLGGGLRGVRGVRSVGGGWEWGEEGGYERGYEGECPLSFGFELPMGAA